MFTQTQQQWLGVQSCLLPRGLPRILLLCVFRGRNGEVELDSSVQFTCSVVSDSLQPHGFPVHHLLPVPTQTPIHWVGDAIQSSHPLSSPSPPAFNLSQHQGLFQRVGSSHQVAEVLEFSFSISPSNEYSGLISFRIDWLDLLAVQNCGVGEDSWKLDRCYNKNPILKQLWWFSC